MKSNAKNQDRGLFPLDAKKLRDRIRRYERALKKESEIKGRRSHDLYGKRYLLGPMYQLIGDPEGALRFYGWFEENYPQDPGHFYQSLSWSLALLQKGDYREACNRLFQTYLLNPFVIPLLLGESLKRGARWMEYTDGMELLEAAKNTPPELFALWDEVALHWAHKFYYHPQVVRERENFIRQKRRLAIFRTGSDPFTLIHNPGEGSSCRAPVHIRPLRSPSVKKIALSKGEEGGEKLLIKLNRSRKPEAYSISRIAPHLTLVK